MKIGESGIFDTARARPTVHPGIEFWRGWHMTSEPVWSRDAEAVLRVCASRFAQPIAMAVRLRTYNADTAPPKTLCIRSDGHDPVEIGILRSGIQTVVFWTPVIKPGAAHGFVSLSISAADSPAQLGQSQDDRLLGFQILDLQENIVPLALPLDLKDPDVASTVLSSGWDKIEAGAGVWSVAAAPKIVLPGHLDLAGVQALEFDVETLPRPADHLPLKIEVWSAKRRLAVWDFADHPGGIRSCPVVPSLTAEGCEIVFRIDGLASPATLGINADTRLLGLFIRSIGHAAPASRPTEER